MSMIPAFTYTPMQIFLQNPEIRTIMLLAVHVSQE